MNVLAEGHLQPLAPFPHARVFTPRSPGAGPGSAQIPVYGAGGAGCGLQPHLQGVGIANARRLQLKGGLGLEQLLLFQQLQPERNMQIFPYIMLVTCPNHIAKSFLESTMLQGTKGEGLNTEQVGKAGMECGRE